MAGAGYKLFQTGDVLTAAQVNTYLNEQTVMVFANSTARTTALSGVLAEGMMSYLQDTNSVEVYNGTSWVALASGDLTEIVAGTGITVTSGTGPIPTVALTTPVAATNGGTAQSTYTTGDLLYASGTNTLAKRAIGSTGNVLTVSGGVPTWAAPATGGMTLLHTITLSTTSHTQSSISGAYKNLVVIGQNLGASAGAAFRLRVHSRTTDYIYTSTSGATIAAGSSAGFDGASNDLASGGGSACQFTFYDYAEASSEKLVIGQIVGNNTGTITNIMGGPFNHQTTISSLTFTTVAGTANLSGTILIYGVN